MNVQILAAELDGSIPGWFLILYSLVCCSLYLCIFSLHSLIIEVSIYVFCSWLFHVSFCFWHTEKIGSLVAFFPPVSFYRIFCLWISYSQFFPSFLKNIIDLTYMYVVMGLLMNFLSHIYSLSKHYPYNVFLVNFLNT